MNQEEEHELTKTEEWFRDHLNNLLGLGGAALLIIAGWLISNDSVFSLARDTGGDKREAAIFLCVSVPVAWGLWYAALLKTHSKCPPHPTVIRRRLLHLCVIGAGVALFVMVFLAVEGAP